MCYSALLLDFSMSFVQTTTVEDATPFTPTELLEQLFPVSPADYLVSLVKNWLAIAAVSIQGSMVFLTGGVKSTQKL